MLDFKKKAGELDEAGIKVVAASADSMEDAVSTVERYDIPFMVGYGLDGPEVSALTGGFYDAEKGYLHAMGFVLAPDGKVVNAVYSTGPLGRLMANDVIGLVKHLSGRE